LLNDLLNMQDELEALFGRTVDLLDRQRLEREPNHLLRRHIFEHLELLHVESSVA
jgi:predicted nucleotidyltransferase